VSAVCIDFIETMNALREQFSAGMQFQIELLQHQANAYQRTLDYASGEGSSKGDDNEKAKEVITGIEHLTMRDLYRIYTVIYTVPLNQQSEAIRDVKNDLALTEDKLSKAMSGISNVWKMNK